jgi:carbamoyltransferase
MARTYGIVGPTHPWLGDLAERLAFAVCRSVCTRNGFHRADSEFARERIRSMQAKLTRGEAIYLLGISSGGHDSGISLVRTSLSQGTELLLNNQEERFTGKKHDGGFPEKSIEALKAEMARLGVGLADIHACVASWDYPPLMAMGTRLLLEEAPASLRFFSPKNRAATRDVENLTKGLFETPRRLGQALGLPGPFPIIGLRHHDNHAYFSYAASPFARGEGPVMIAVLDGAGDDGAISLYEARGGRLRMLYDNRGAWDSLGVLYAVISSTQGGWTMSSSEGRYMGAAAWGNTDRLTNPYYMRLRQLLYLGAEGEIRLNRALSNWHRQVPDEPYSRELIDILGPPIPTAELWNPDAVLNVEDVKHAEITRDRVDKAAALQLLFEDALFHVIAHLIRTTGSHRLVLTGGCALNCVANMHLLAHFDEAYYERYLGQPGVRLHLWVPPTPCDSGVIMGAAFHFAMAHGGAPPGGALEHAFYCGPAPTTSEISDALETTPEIGYLRLDDVIGGDEGDKLHKVADLLSYIVAQNGVIGIFQGRAETGPRALGHRSIVANPCNPRTLDVLNELVKRREKIRPLAPMATYEAARRYFELSPGASDGDHNAYNYMVLTARVRPEGRAVIPAVVHRDGTGRVQIVREETDPFNHAYLKAMGRRLGVEVSVNTSLNVGGPIAQTPAQALEALKRSFGMTGLLLIGSDGRAAVAWHNVVKPPKDAGARLRGWIEAWKAPALRAHG